MKTGWMLPLKDALKLMLLLKRSDMACCLSAMILFPGLMVKAFDYDYSYTGGKVTITKYHGPSGAVTIPSMIEGMPVVAIGHQAFYYIYSIASVTIPNSVTRIEYEAFYHCGLGSVNIGSGVTSIGSLAFSYTAMTGITVNVNNPAFSSLNGVLFNKNRTSLIQYPGAKTGSYTIPSGVISIESDAFNFCYNLEGLAISSSVKSIGNNAFYDCHRLDNVSIPSSVTNIGDRAFYNCIVLTNISVNAQNSAYSSLDGILFNKNKTILIQCPIGKGGDYMIPDSVMSIADSAFYSCASLRDVKIPDSVTNIKDWAFANCSRMTNVWIGNSVTNIGGSAFSGCTQLNNVTLGNSIDNIGGWAFNSCNSLRNITFPDSVSRIGRYAFTFCGLTSLTIPPKVASIRDSTFTHCVSLTNVTIPQGVTNIEEGAFSYCSRLRSITIPASVINIGDSAFSRCDELAAINVDLGNPNYSSDDGVLYDKTQEHLIYYPAARGHYYNIPASVTRLGDCVFDSSTSLTIFFQGNAPYAGSWIFPFASTPAIYYVQGTTGWGQTFSGHPITQIPFALTVDNDAITITGYAGYGGDIAIPDTIAGLPVVNIGNGAFSSCVSLVHVNIPSGITNIGEWAFQNCTNLNVITVDEFNPSYTSVDGVLFSENYSRLVRYPEGKTGSYAIPESVTRIDSQAFFGSMLTNIVIPAGVTDIGVGAFAACSQVAAITAAAQNVAYCTIEGVVFDINQTTLIACPSGKTGVFVIPSSVTNIAEYAFFGCSSLTGVTIPESVTHIGRNAFTGCSNLVSIMIPGRVAMIGAEAFGDCNRLTTLTVDATNSVYSSIEGVLFDKSQTTFIQYPGGKVGYYTIPDSVIHVEDKAFSGCTRLACVTIPNSVSTIGNSAFASCSSLTNVTIGSSISYIGNESFANCTNLVGIYFTGNAPRCGLSVFSGDNRVIVFYVSGTMGWGLTFGGRPALDALVPYMYTTSFDRIYITKYVGFGGAVNIPSTINGLPVGAIGVSAFSHCADLTSVKIPDGVQMAIGSRAFYSCSNLVCVAIGNGVLSIGESAFQNCTSLTNVLLGNGISSIYNYAFSRCVSLTSITIPNGVRMIGHGAFDDCTSLASVSIPDSVTQFGDDWFSSTVPFFGCTSLRIITVSSGNAYYSSLDGVLLNKAKTLLVKYPGGKVGNYTVPGSVTNIGDFAFAECSGLTSVVMSNSVTRIGDRAFENCGSLTNVVVGKRVVSIGEYAFNSCSKLTGIIIPSSVTCIGSALFWNCTNLTSVIIPDSVTNMGQSVFQDCTALREVVIGNRVREIGWGMFRFCSSLDRVVINSSVTTIGDCAFESCTSLVNITIPSSVTNIDFFAFSYCINLTDVFYKGNAPSVDPDAFYQVYNATIYYLPGTTGWNGQFCGLPTVMLPNQPPLVTGYSPTSASVTISEGGSTVFRFTVNDTTDPETAARGISNIVWFVDDVARQETRVVSLGDIISTFTFKSDLGTVQFAAFSNVAVRAVATDRSGGTAVANWTVQVNNVAALQTITFPILPVKALGDPDFVPGARASSGLSVVYSNSNPAVAQVVGGMIQIVGTGTAVITAFQPGNFDYKAALPVKQTLTVKANLTANMPIGGGTVTGTGLYLPGTRVALTAKPATGSTFLRWEDGSKTAVRSLVMPNANLTVSAWFNITTNVPKPVITNPGLQSAMVGVPFTLALDITSDSLPTVTVTGLPSGLAYSAATKAIAGVPTASVTNMIKVTAKNVNKTAGTQEFMMTVDSLPLWAVGSFNGIAETDAMGSGSATMSVTALGAASGKLTLRGTNFSYSAKSYSHRDINGAFWLTATATVGKAAWPITVSVRQPAVTDTTGTVPQTLSKAEGVFGADGLIGQYRNVWKDADMLAVATNYTGYYTATLPGGSEYGSGYLAFTVDKLGGVKTVGKLADGTAVSLSGPLVLDEAGRVFAVLYTAPVAYKGGGLFGLAEFVKGDAGTRVTVRPLGNGPFVWDNLNLTATQVYGTGFSRDLGLTGGWYDTMGNLYAYYANRTLTVGTEVVPVPEMLVGTNRYDSVWWTPDGLALKVTTNSTGLMTGLVGPRLGAPIKLSATAYDYANATNAVGFTIGLTRATGVFKGSFKAWFDYLTPPTSKTIAYEGVLTPAREGTDDGIAGRGFFLWSDTRSYVTPAGKATPYSFSWSYDLTILLSDPVP